MTTFIVRVTRTTVRHVDVEASDGSTAVKMVEEAGMEHAVLPFDYVTLHGREVDGETRVEIWPHRIDREGCAAGWP